MIKWTALFSMMLLAIMPGGLQAMLKFEQTVIEDVVTPGEKTYPFEFSFENKGESAVEITEIKTTCGCTTAKLEKMTYEPGEVGMIKGTFSVGNRQGKQDKKVQVLTRNLAQPEIQLSLKLDIPELVTVKPGLLLWRVGSEPETKALRLHPNKEFGVEVLSVESKSSRFQVEALNVAANADHLVFNVTPSITGECQNGLIRITVAAPKLGTKILYAHAMIR